MRAAWIGVGLAVTAAALSGCRATTRASFLNLIGLTEEPLGVMHVGDLDDDGALIRIFNPFETYRELNAALGKELKREIAPDLCLLFQLEPNLRLGVADLAFLTPVHYAQLSSPSDYRVVAVSVDRAGRIEREALLIAPADGPIHSIEDLRGQAVGFGRSSDASTHYAAVALLEASGLRREDLSQSLLPRRGTRHYVDPMSIARDVQSGVLAAGFVDSAWWEELPVVSNDGQIGQDRFRVIHRTAALPQRMIIAGPKMDDATFQHVRNFFTTVARRHHEALEPLEISGYSTPEPQQLEAWVQRLGRVGPSRPRSTDDEPAATAWLIPDEQRSADHSNRGIQADAVEGDFAEVAG